MHLAKKVKIVPVFLIKPLIIAAIIGCVSSIAYYNGYTNAQQKYKKDALEQAAQSAKTLAGAIKYTEDKTRELYEDKIRHITNSKPLPDKCLLSSEFRVQFNATTGLPEVTTARAVTPAEVIAATRENNFACRQNAIWLEECNAVCR